MNKILTGYLLALVLVAGFAFEALSLSVSSSFFTKGAIKLDSLEITMGKNSMLFEEIDGSGKIKITEKGELFIGDNKISTTGENQVLLIDFYHKTELIYNKAMVIANDGIQVGKQGAKVGGKGAMLGLKAIAGAITMLATFDSDSFEKMMEREAAKVDTEAAIVDKMAGKIDETADRLEKYTKYLNTEIEQLKSSIKELSTAKWFRF